MQISAAISENYSRDSLLNDVVLRKHRSPKDKADFIIRCLSSNASIAECCRLEGVAEGSFYLWRSKFIAAGMSGLSRKTLKKRPSRKSAQPAQSQHELADIKSHYGNLLYTVASTNGHLSDDMKMSVIKIVSQSRIANSVILNSLGISRSSYYRWLSQLELHGTLEIGPKSSPEKLSDQDHIKSTIFKVLHSPPKKYGSNRSSWVYAELQKAIESEGVRVGQHSIRAIIRAAGYRWLKAKKVLTSNDPEYRQKVDRIHQILSALKPTEGFFSIDEYGPFAVKKRQGKKLIPAGQSFSVPQWQKSKGYLIITAALELSTNQVTHFYSTKKDTDEMIILLDLLLQKYRHLDRIFLSWDAASWHLSKKLFKKIELHNENAAAAKLPLVDLAPLPAGAQFLNVIESVFSGMARAVIHNSDYASIDAAKVSIDRHFENRNAHFRDNPRRAGNKIWGKERTSPTFSESNNCKDPKYR